MPEGTRRHPDVPTLRRFQFLDFLTDDQMDVLCHSLIVQHGHVRKRLIGRGDTAEFCLLLLDGRVSLDDGAGIHFEIGAGSEPALAPIAPGLPRRFDVVALGEVAYLELDNRLIEGLRQRREGGTGAPCLPSSKVDAAEHWLLQRVTRDLADNCLRLPSLPEVALRIGRALEEDNTDARRIAALLQNDPAITAKLIWVANSAYYPGRRNSASCAEAVMRLGFRTTYQLVLSLALREVFDSRVPGLRQRMRELWEHSVKVAALCRVLAGQAAHCGFDPEHALLGGLVHDLGVVTLLAYVEDFPALAEDPAALQRVIDALRAEAGAAVLQAWGFDASLVACARYAEDWRREHEPPPQYSDLVAVAHGLLDGQGWPALDDLPSVQRLGLGAIFEPGAPAFLQSAEDQLSRTEALLGV